MVWLTLLQCSVNTSDENFLSQLQNQLCLGYLEMGWKGVSILPPSLNSLQFCGSAFGTVRVKHQAFSAFIGLGGDFQRFPARLCPAV